MKQKKLKKWTCILAAAIAGVFLSLPLSGAAARAGTLIEDTADGDNEYSKYPDENYQLDFYVDMDWAWLPWNWQDGIGKSGDKMLHSLANMVWGFSRDLSNATGYIVQEAYSLDFISKMSREIGENIKTLAGITRKGLGSEGFYAGMMLMLVLVLGVYVAYTGLLKRETSRAFGAVINFTVIFLLSACFIAYASNYILKINEFSSDMSTSALSLGTRMLMPGSDTKGSDSVDLIRDSLFGIQVKQPWLLLQFGSSDVGAIGEERVERILSADPGMEREDSVDGKIREDIVREEIEENGNRYMTPGKIDARLGMVFLFLACNTIISVFVILLAGLMLFSQILFIFYAMMLPFSFALSMIPTYNGLAKKAVERVFNVIMLRTGYTIIITVAFSISSMLYSLSSDKPFIFVIFLQILTFAGIFIRQNELLGMLSLQGGDNYGTSRQLARSAQRHARRGAGKLYRGTRKFLSKKYGQVKGFAQGRATIERVREDFPGHAKGAGAGQPDAQGRPDTASPSPGAPDGFGKKGQAPAGSASARGGGNSPAGCPAVPHGPGKKKPSGSAGTHKPAHQGRPGGGGPPASVKSPDPENNGSSPSRRDRAHGRPAVRNAGAGHEKLSGQAKGDIKSRRENTSSRPGSGEAGHKVNVNGIPYTAEQIRNGEHDNAGGNRGLIRRSARKAPGKADAGNGRDDA